MAAIDPKILEAAKKIAQDKANASSANHGSIVPVDEALAARDKLLNRAYQDQYGSQAEDAQARLAQVGNYQPMTVENPGRGTDAAAMAAQSYTTNQADRYNQWLAATRGAQGSRIAGLGTAMASRVANDVRDRVNTNSVRQDVERNAVNTTELNRLRQKQSQDRNAYEVMLQQELERMLAGSGGGSGGGSGDGSGELPPAGLPFGMFPASASSAVPWTGAPSTSTKTPAEVFAQKYGARPAPSKPKKPADVNPYLVAQRGRTKG